MKKLNIYTAVLATMALAACEDYTEHNFGTREELYQPTQISTVKVTLSDANYEDIAKNLDNIAMALAADTDSTTYLDLLSVGEKKYFRGEITPDAFLPPLLRSLVGSSQYYAMTPGSNIVVTYRSSADSTVNGPAYLRTGTFDAGRYLMAPQGMEQVLAHSGEGKDYGYIFPSGSTTCPTAVTHLTEEAITADDAAKGYLYFFEKDGDSFLIRNALGLYLYMDGSHNSFQYTDDVENDVDEREYAQWQVTKNDDNSFDIVNVATGQQILYGTSFGSAGCYTDKKGEEGYLGIELYEEGTISTIVDGPVEEGQVTFTLDEDGWSAKGDYLNQTLLGYSSTKVDEVYATYGWSIEHVGSIGELSYVWNASSIYGLRASAYVNGTRYDTESWCISPSMNLKKAKEPLFAFDQAQRFAGTPVTDWLQVWVSKDYSGRGGQSTATWEDKTFDVVGQWPDGADWTFYHMKLDLTPYAGEPNVVVAFRYRSSSEAEIAPTWEIQNVRCAEASEFAEE
ncbi:MAG: choice-of-anchor J domain-containing protein [Bacteroidaceae bacterium]|nr:choice-of-anchor J domain-containing protein [Bacteroidaceae bacterium]